MTDTPDVPAIEADRPPPTAQPLGRIAASGFAWSFVLTIVGKGVTLASQILLAHKLYPPDYAVVSLATAMAILPSVLRDGGITQVLVQRQDQFRELANAAFWMSAALGLLAAGTIVALAPKSGHIYQSPIVPKLMLILAATAIVNALTVLPSAKLQIDLRLRFNAVLNAGVLTLTALFSVLLAWRNFGPYALVLPLLIVAILRAVAQWGRAPAAIGLSLDFRKWKLFFVDGGLLMGMAFFWSITIQGDNAILGYFDHGDALGYYVFAFGLSMQSMQLLAGTLNGIMFATLTRIKGDAARQRNAIIEATRLSAAVMLPLALFPVICPSAILSLFFDAKWLPSATLLQLLSVAAALASVGYPMGSYLMSQGRNRTVFLFSAVMSAVFVLLVLLGTKTAGANGTAIAVAVFQLLQAVVGLHLVLRPGGPTAAVIARAVGIPLLVSAVTVGLGGAIMLQHPLARLAALPQIAVAFTLTGIVYLILLRVAAPDIFRKLLGQVRASLWDR